MPDAIITLAGIKAIRLKRGITDKQLASLTDIPHDRMKALESHAANTAAEPWLDEAGRIAGALGTEGVEPLLGGPMLRDIETGFDIQDDLATWETGTRLPLRYGIRLGRMFGIEPLDLLRTAPVYSEIWRIIATGERAPTQATCPWCDEYVIGDHGHKRTCLPNQLLGPRITHISAIGTPPKPRKPGTRKQGSRNAPGLKKLREKLGLTQAQFASAIGRDATYYPRLEQLRDPLTGDLAEIIAATFKVSLHEVYYGD